jgi:hypothetical protein
VARFEHIGARNQTLQEQVAVFLIALSQLVKRIIGVRLTQKLDIFQKPIIDS